MRCWKWRYAKMSTVEIVSDVTQGQLLKWTNYVKGYRNRWFLLQNGFLSYYKFDHVHYFLYTFVTLDLGLKPYSTLTFEQPM